MSPALKSLLLALLSFRLAEYDSGAGSRFEYVFASGWFALAIVEAVRGRRR